MKEQDAKQEARIAVLEEQMKRIDYNVTKIMDNHLPHIQRAINKLDWKFAMWGGAVAVAMWVIEHFADGKIVSALVGQ